MMCNEAAAELGISRRTIQRRARSGQVETRPGVDGTIEYRVPRRDVTPADTVPLMPPVTGTGTPPDTAETLPAVEELRALLAAEQTSRVDAERRAAVAEYRAEIAEVDPEVVEELRAQVAELEEHAAKATTERDEARAQGQRLAAAMTKRHALIKRLTARLGEVGQ